MSQSSMRFPFERSRTDSGRFGREVLGNILLALILTAAVQPFRPDKASLAPRSR